MGYTPVFGSIYAGTLWGRWPMAPVWASLLPLADARGQIDLSYEAIAGMTGWPLELLRQGIEQLCEPDPHSRSRAEEGRRLVLIDPARSWGWRVVNHELYREKARQAMHTAEQVADGRNAEKVRRYRERLKAAGDTTRHHETPHDTAPHSETLSQTQTQTQTETKRETSALSAPLDGAIRQDAVASRSTPRGRSVPVDHPEEIASPDVIAWARTHAPDVELKGALAEFIDYWRGVPGARGRKLDWPATFRNRLRELQGKRVQSRQARGPVLLPVADG